jgi:formate dehydrogenase subunit delta
MNPSNLIKMANQIGAFFEAMPDSEQAKRDVASHILNSWEPRMRRSLLNHIASAGDEMLKPVVREALSIIRDS